MPIISLRVRGLGQASSVLALFAALALTVALIACLPVGPTNSVPTEAATPPPTTAGATVGRATGTLDGSFHVSLSGGDFREEGTSTYSVTVRLEWSPAADAGAGAWVDDGSTYTLTSTSTRTQHVTVGSGSCDVVSKFGQTGSGSFGVDGSQLNSSGAAGSSRLEIGGRLTYVEHSTIDTCGIVTTEEITSSRAFPPDSCNSDEPPIMGPHAPANSRRVFEWNCDSSSRDTTSKFTGQVELICWPQPVSCPTWE